jgi:sigma-B regulation protein RsbU (phosphoserine phosphatase)
VFPVIDVSPVWQQTLPGTDFKDSKQVLESLNIAFPGEENNDMFFTIWHGVNNKNTRELTYASGGHPPALLLGDYLQLIQTLHCCGHRVM